MSSKCGGYNVILLVPTYAPSPVLDDFMPVFSFHPPMILKEGRHYGHFTQERKKKTNKTVAGELK